jgi:trehalose 6-phosphate synthase/phosphatase
VDPKPIDYLSQALTMSDEEAASSWLVRVTRRFPFNVFTNLVIHKDLHRHVAAQTAQNFTNSFLTRVIRAYNDHQRGTDVESVALFDVSRVLTQYKYSAKRLLLLDLEDTLWTRKTSAGFIKQGTPCTIPQDVFDLLNKLNGDPKNEVWVLSGLPIKGGMDQFASNAPGVGLM